MQAPYAYATYFDQRYLARALVMLRSLRRHDPNAPIFALCFDRISAEMVASLDEPGIVAITHAAMLDTEPRLAACSERSRWEFYATHKAILPLHLLEHYPGIDAIAHIDADTCFYSSPADLFAELGHASIGLSPHRFSPAFEPAIIHGQFNAGFVYWRRDATGLRCLREFRDQCLAWCFNRVEPDGRYMNQGYLTAWPQRYDNVQVLRHPGANLAYWNIAGHQLTVGNPPQVDGQPLVFYHFSNIHRDAAGQWRTPYFDFGAGQAVAVQEIYFPYLALVDEMARWLQSRAPGLLTPDVPQAVESMPVVQL
jgi:hypothetical protein